MGEVIQLRVVSKENNRLVRLTDPILDLTVADFTAIEAPTVSNPASLALGSSIVKQLCFQVPGLSQALATTLRASSTGALQVSFSSAVKAGLTSGKYSLMSSDLPIAVNQAHKIVQIAKVSPTTALVGGAGPLAGAGAAAASAPIWPLVLVTAIAVAATLAEHRWLEKNFSALHDALARIEMRLRDDDLGAIEAANHIIDLIRPDLDNGEVHDLHRYRLMVAAHDIDSIYMARRRFVDRFKHKLEDRQNQHEERTGKSLGWVGGVADEIADSKAGPAEEISVFLAAMIARARVTAATARLLAVSGDPVGALRFASNWEEGVRQDYSDLYRRLRPLANFEPQDPRWKQLLPPILKDDDNKKAREAVLDLVERMERAIGPHIPEPVQSYVLEAALTEADLDQAVQVVSG